MDLNIYTNITLVNPDVERIEVRYDNKSYGFIESGQTMTLPYFLANHVAKHLINQILNRLKIPLNNQPKRDEWRAKIVINEEQYKSAKPLTEQDRLQAEIDRLNAKELPVKRNLDGILGKKREDAPALPEDKEETVPSGEPVSPPSPEVAEVVEVNPTPPTTPIDPPVIAIPSNPPVSVTPVAPSGVDPELAAVKPDVVGETDRTTPPTREQLYSFLSDELRMNLNDEKTLIYLEATPIESLIEEFNYFEMKA